MCTRILSDLHKPIIVARTMGWPDITLQPAPVHLAIKNSSRTSASVENPNWIRNVHPGRQFTILTNEPAYAEHIRMLRARDFSNPSEDPNTAQCRT